MLGLTGTKFGCGMALCGACTVHIDGAAGARVHHADVGRRRQEGHHHRGDRRDKVGKPVQAAWIELGVPQCGYCQSGQIMSAAALLKQNAKPTDADIDEAMAGNICRCGTYHAHPRRDQAGRREQGRP